MTSKKAGYAVLAAMLGLFLGFAFPTETAEASEPGVRASVTYNGNYIDFTQPPVIRNGYTFFPLEDLLTGIGAVQGWNGDTYTVSGTLGGNVLEIPLTDLGYVVNGTRIAVPWELLPFVEGERTYVYPDSVAEAFGLETAWDGLSGTIVMSGMWVERIEFESNDVTVDIGDVIAAVPILYPANALPGDIEFTSSDNAVVTVTADGIIQAVGAGQAMVVCRVGEAAARITVTVEFSIAVPDMVTTCNTFINNYARVTPVHQFLYVDQGFAYAYLSEDRLVITTPENTFSLDVMYPKLGDVISDGDGNFYVVWGRDNDAGGAVTETVFISKFSPQGRHIKSTGFIGASSPWQKTDGAMTQTPFYAGNCVSVIANGVLVNYHGKLRYDGHQSDIAIAVNIDDMSVCEAPMNTYAGHSFNQSVIYSEKAAGFLFASHGDAYIRGFRVNGADAEYDDDSQTLFHFYLESNADYNMSIVNKTFAQLGGIAETSVGVALVGASAKSLSESAKTERQNLFVQVFDPNFDTVSPAMFIGGSPRGGATSFDINDNANSPLTPVTDYGVRWLTGYTDKDVVNPAVVEADDKLVILWTTTENESMYMVLSASGDVVVPETSLGDTMLNSFERPVYHDGAVHWVSVWQNRLRIHRLEIMTTVSDEKVIIS